MSDAMPSAVCDWCKKSFVPTAADFYEGGISIDDFGEVLSGEEWKGKTGLAIADFSPAALAYIKEQTGLNHEQMVELLAKGHVEDMGACVCPECIIASEQADER